VVVHIEPMSDEEIQLLAEALAEVLEWTSAKGL
jgi:hypothetical protein